jgi:hypothetical protein
VLQFDEDLVGRDIASEDSNLSDYSAELLQLRMEGTGQDQSERNDEKLTEFADHGLHRKKRKGPFSGYESGPRKSQSSKS